MATMQGNGLRGALLTNESTSAVILVVPSIGNNKYAISLLGVNPKNV
jgi:hypothetical protein